LVLVVFGQKLSCYLFLLLGYFSFFLFALDGLNLAFGLGRLELLDEFAFHLVANL
jgi:hypothetical protein